MVSIGARKKPPDVRRQRPAKKHAPVDKSALMFGEPERIVDKAYRAFARDRACMACGHSGDGSVVLAHISRGGNGIMGGKAGDDESLWLCSQCHNGGPDSFDLSTDRDGWLVDRILIPARKLAYKLWRSGK